MDRKEWIFESWSCSGEVPQKYVITGCEAWVDWAVNEKDLSRSRDILNNADWDAVYRQEWEDHDEILALESSVYDQLRATPASTPSCTNTEAATNMNALSMNSLEAPAGSLPDLHPNF